MVTELYRRAEAELRKQRRLQRSNAGAPRPVSDPNRLLHELQVHQVELELQNAELRTARDQMEVLLEEYTDLYDFAPAGYFTLGTDGTVKLVNFTGAQLIGIERARLVGQPFARWVSPQQRPAFQEFLTRVFAGPGPVSCDVELACPGQPARFVSMEARRLSRGEDCRAAVVDITRRKQAEDKVRVSEIRYRRLFEAAHDGVLLLDPETRKITDANPFMTRLLGYTHDELVGKELFEIGLLKDEAVSQEMFRKLQRKHQVRYEDLPLESQAGRHQEVEVVANLYQENGHPVIQCNIRDITARKRAETAQRRLEVLTASNRRLNREIARRRAVEKSLRQSERDQRGLLAQAQRLQDQLRQLSRQVIQAQENERKRISRELHDVIAQALTGISVRLGSLKKASTLDSAGLDRSIASTQRLVKRSVEVVHQFARELRPTVLDDLGLIPALHSYLKQFAAQTGVRTRLTAFAGVEQVNITRRTVLFRVAQEALTNVGRHAQATRVDVSIQKLPGGICMRVADDGKSFPVQQVLRSQGRSHLGLLGMQERLEMVGGRFRVQSAPGKGTTIEAQIPLGKARAGGGGR